MYSVNVKTLLEHCPILDTPPWDTPTPVTAESVKACLDTNSLMDTPLGAIGTPYDHCARIAWYVKNGWEDPIVIDVGVPSSPGHQTKWLIDDGNHRFFAAVMRGDETIQAEASGCLDTFETLFT